MKKRVRGENCGDILLYTLSTCIWCKKTKELLNALGVEYDFIDVDLLSGAELDKVKSEMQKWNPRMSFPTIVIGDKCVVGFDEPKIREVLHK
jgi:glutaredoxin